MNDFEIKKKTDRKRSSWEALNVRSSTLLYVLCDQRLYSATPIDPFFLLYNLSINYEDKKIFMTFY